MFGGGLVEFNVIQIMSGTEPFVLGFNLVFTIVTIFGFISVCVKALLKVITRS